MKKPLKFDLVVCVSCMFWLVSNICGYGCGSGEENNKDNSSNFGKNHILIIPDSFDVATYGDCNMIGRWVIVLN